jgi:ABC-2 type transport system permease protein
MAAALRRPYGAVNWRGLGTLILKDVRRSLREYRYNILGPVVASLLFLAVFALAAGRDDLYVADLTYLQFLVPGLVIFAVCERAYATSSESLLFDKMEGMITDTLMAPLTPTELTVGYACSAAGTGLITGAAVAAPLLVLTDLPLSVVPLALLFAVGGALMHGLLGTIVGLWAERWDHHTAALTFLVIPFAFLSGTFYSIKTLPETVQHLVRLNPVFYVIDGFRAGSAGYADAPTILSLIVVLLVVLVLGLLTYRLFRIGYKLKP